MTGTGKRRNEVRTNIEQLHGIVTREKMNHECVASDSSMLAVL